MKTNRNLYCLFTLLYTISISEHGHLIKNQTGIKKQLGGVHFIFSRDTQYSTRLNHGTGLTRTPEPTNMNLKAVIETFDQWIGRRPLVCCLATHSYDRNKLGSASLT